MIKVWSQIVALFAPFLHQSVTFYGFHCFHFQGRRPQTYVLDFLGGVMTNITYVFSEKKLRDKQRDDHVLYSLALQN